MKESSPTQHSKLETQNSQIFSVLNVSTGYGKKQVLFDVNLTVQEGETVLLIGSNGSGKSTLFKAIFGVLPLWRGEVSFDGDVLHSANLKLKTPNSKLLPQGVMYIPQKDELFEDMMVEDNLLLSVLYLKDKKESQKRISQVFENMNILQDKRRQVVSELSGGERKLLSLGMALMNKPKLLLYDEPLAGLSNNNIKVVLNWLKTIKESGTTLVIIEHRIKELMGLADKVVGLKLGRRNAEALENIESIKNYMI